MTQMTQMTQMTEPRAALVLLAAGSGTRVGHEVNKVFLTLAGVPVVAWSLRRAAQVSSIVRTVLVVAEADRSLATSVIAQEAIPGAVELVIGGATRHESEWRGLAAIADEIRRAEIDVVVMHDAARPLAETAVFADVVAQAAQHGGALPARPQPGLVSLRADDAVDAELDQVVSVQTPQAFRALPLLVAYEAAERDGFIGTDTASCVERYTDLAVRCVPGSAENIKITFREDLVLAEQLLAAAQTA
jgi:2-C-methyl-D-erythritol 4-phosphate cytidylyltransferase